MKAVTQKKQTMYKDKHIKIIADFSTENLKVIRAWNEVFWAPNENNFSTKILYPTSYPAKLIE
jgi:hypothetical protein